MAVIFIESRTRDEVSRQTGEVNKFAIKSRASFHSRRSRRCLVISSESRALESAREASELALLLRAGALAAPIYLLKSEPLVQVLVQRISRGVLTPSSSALFWLCSSWSRLSWIWRHREYCSRSKSGFADRDHEPLQAVLTLPGIAGIVLTVGMAVDAMC